MEFFKGGGGWTPRLVRPFNDWEIEEIICLLQTIQGKRVIDSQDDLMFLRSQEIDAFQ